MNLFTTIILLILAIGSVLTGLTNMNQTEMLNNQSEHIKCLEAGLRYAGKGVCYDPNHPAFKNN